MNWVLSGVRGQGKEKQGSRGKPGKQAKKNHPLLLKMGIKFLLFHEED